MGSLLEGPSICVFTYVPTHPPNYQELEKQIQVPPTFPFHLLLLQPKEVLKIP